MNSKTRANMAIAVTGVLSLIALGYLYGFLCSITPAGWHAPDNLLLLAGNTLVFFFGSLLLLMLFLSSPVGPLIGLILAAIVFCCVRFRPRSGLRHCLLLLGLPLIPVMMLPFWASFVACSRPMDLQVGGFYNSWEMHILGTLHSVAITGIAIAAAYFSFAPGWKNKRIFALSLIALEVVTFWLESGAASMVVSNVFL